MAPSEIRCEGGVILGGYVFPHDPLDKALPGSKRYNLFSSLDVAAGARVVLASFDLGTQEWAAIKGLGMEILDSPAGRALEGFAQVTWSIQINGTRVQFYETIRDQIGLGYMPASIDVMVDYPGAAVELVAENAAAAPNTYRCFGRITGWIIPLTERA